MQLTPCRLSLSPRMAVICGLFRLSAAININGTSGRKRGSRPAGVTEARTRSDQAFLDYKSGFWLGELPWHGIARPSTALRPARSTWRTNEPWNLPPRSHKETRYRTVSPGRHKEPEQQAGTARQITGSGDHVAGASALRLAVGRSSRIFPRLQSLPSRNLAPGIEEFWLSQSIGRYFRASRERLKHT